jgi:hypothetical protein
MGRNSVEATKACLILAILAERAAPLARLAGFLPFAAGLAGVFACVLVAFGLGLAEAAGLADWAEELAGLWAETGSAAMSMASATARQRVDSGAGVGETTALMFPL